MKIGITCRADSCSSRLITNLRLPLRACSCCMFEVSCCAPCCAGDGGRCECFPGSGQRQPACPRQGHCPPRPQHPAVGPASTSAGQDPVCQHASLHVHSPLQRLPWGVEHCDTLPQPVHATCTRHQRPSPSPSGAPVTHAWPHEQPAQTGGQGLQVLRPAIPHQVHCPHICPPHQHQRH